MVIIDPKTRTIENLNDAAMMILGSTKDDIIGKKCYQYLCPGLDGGPCPACDKINDVKYLERSLERADGKRLLILKTAKKMNIRGQERMIECFLDMTEYERARIAVRETNKKLNLLSNITRHDINNQLNILTGFLTLMEEEENSTVSEQYLKKALSAADRISAMIQFTKAYEDIGINAPTWHNVKELIDDGAKGVNLGDIELIN